MKKLKYEMVETNPTQEIYHIYENEDNEVCFNYTDTNYPKYYKPSFEGLYIEKCDEKTFISFLEDLKEMFKNEDILNLEDRLNIINSLITIFKKKPIRLNLSGPWIYDGINKNIYEYERSRKTINQ